VDCDRDDDKLRGVQMSDGCVVPRDALLVQPRFVPNNRLLVGLDGSALSPLGFPVDLPITGVRQRPIPGVTKCRWNASR
jgi:hypothetical protein